MAESYHLSQMGGMRRLARTVTVAGFGVLFVALGCSKSPNTEGTTITTASSEETQPRSSKPSRSEIACRLHSCAPPYFCNEDKGVCERLPCAASQDCPYGYACNFSHNVCE
jgi:hypothetical protein